MKDSYGRTIDYMRISITDRCNLRCKYCMPCGVDTVSHQDILTFEEIRKVALCGAGLGIRHIKVTGGEPLVRKGCCELIRILKAVPGIEHVTLTTNGILLGKYLEELVRSGIDGINISLDTLDQKLYEQITGQNGLAAVMDVLEKTKTLTVPVKINAVSVDWEEIGKGDEEEREKTKRAEREKNEGVEREETEKAEQEKTERVERERTEGVEREKTEGVEREEVGTELAQGRPGRKKEENWKELALLAKKYPVDVRFIEMMPIGYGREYKTLNHEELLEKMMQEFPGMEREKKVHGFGPAVYYRIPGFLGSIGLIIAIHGKFCGNCNRVRLTAQGFLKTCLCYEEGVDLRAILRSGKENELDRITAAIRGSISGKPAAHCFEMPDNITEQHNMVDIGG